MSNLPVAGSLLCGAFSVVCLVRAYRTYSTVACRAFARQILYAVAATAISLAISRFLEDRGVEDGEMPGMIGSLLQDIMFLGSIVCWIAVATRRRQLMR